jgi:hypothetical protein
MWTRNAFVAITLALSLTGCGAKPAPEAGTPTPSPVVTTPTPVETVTPKPVATPSPETKAAVPKDVTSLQRTFELYYKDAVFALTTRDVDAMMKGYTVPFLDDEVGLQNEAQVRADLQELVDDLNAMEEEAETTLRFGGRTKILTLKAEGPDKVAVRARFTLVIRNPSTGVRWEIVSEGTDVFVSTKDGWKMCASRDYKDISDGIVEGKPTAQTRRPSYSSNSPDRARQNLQRRIQADQQRADENRRYQELRRQREIQARKDMYQREAYQRSQRR